MDFDFIIVGGGSAGAVFANRLSADGTTRVLLLEAGRDTPPGAEPPEVLDTFHSAVYSPLNTWPGLTGYFADRSVARPNADVPKRYEQGRIMGGGSSVNAMVAIRGSNLDYDEWAAMGADGWSYDDVLPYLVKLERDLDFDGPVHGKDGPTPIRRNMPESWPPFTKAAAEVVAAEGYGYVADHNAEFVDGYSPCARNCEPDRRVSTAAAYLDRATRARSNLEIRPNSLVEGLVVEGTRIVGVKVAGSDTPIQARETIVCAGTLHSPGLLLRAGIGPAADLKQLGIEPIADRPGVGRNLQDHPFVVVAAHLKPAARQARSNHPAANALFRYSSGLPDCPPQDMFLFFHGKSGWHPLFLNIGMVPVCIYKPASRGRLSLRSADFHDEPHIEFGLLGDRRDLDRLKDGVRRTLGWFDQPALAGISNNVFLASYTDKVRMLNRLATSNWWRSWAVATLFDTSAALRNSLMQKVAGVGAETDRLKTDDELLDGWVRDNVAPFFHASGTCRMGRADDPDAVVDPAGRVIGVDGLRVVDASIMPSIVRANTNLTVIMSAEKIADAILAENR